MTKKEKVQEFINNLNWKTQIESNEQYAIAYENNLLKITSMTQFCKYANKLGYSARCNDGINLTLTLKCHKIY